MSYLIDTNILVYAANAAAPEHTVAHHFLETSVAKGCLLTWGIVYEFLRVTTHPAFRSRRLTTVAAKGFIGNIINAPSVDLLFPTNRHWELLQQTLQEVPNAEGNFLHDLRIAVIMREHGIREIATVDRAFRRFKFLRVLNPITR